GAAIPIGIFENGNSIGAFAGRGRKRVLEGLCDPHSAFGVESDVDRLADVGLGGIQLNLKTFREHKPFALSFRGACIRGANVLIIFLPAEAAVACGILVTICFLARRGDDQRGAKENHWSLIVHYTFLNLSNMMR